MKFGLSDLFISVNRSRQIVFYVPFALLLCAVAGFFVEYKFMLQFKQSSPSVKLEGGNLNTLQRQLDNLLIRYKPFRACRDSVSASDPTRSKIQLKGNHVINLGDTIRLNVILFDGYGKAKSTGGDHLRARLFAYSFDAFAPCTVLDNRNGTYTVTAEALWTGWSKLEVDVLFPKEIIATALRIRTTWDFSDIEVAFHNLNVFGTSMCNPNKVMLEKKSETDIICNFSYWNKTMPWFCAKPHGRNISCKHWVSIGRSWTNYTNTLSKCEQELSGRPFYF
ncbi:NXPE family member 3-like isoform X2 [Mercenaria mercenaria]|uniref:NXPE family member 3-like isoform X2 n=1 Tax=Mercenaria mercenaria TaxID=6596 RepID=UPI001E1E0EEA|nr:NXPE family member 3-like isoform X2 [Mercenaria mercenaria]